MRIVLYISLVLFALMFIVVPAYWAFELVKSIFDPLTNRLGKIGAGCLAIICILLSVDMLLIFVEVLMNW